MAGFTPEQLSRELGREHRDAMLDLVLTWASLDSALGMVLTKILGRPMHEGPEIVAGMSSSKRFEEIRRALAAAPGGEIAAKLMRRRKKKYERFSGIRNRIAHSRCAGTWKKDYVVFAVFERKGDTRLAVECIPLDEMRMARGWGQEMLRVFMQIVDYSEG